MLHVKHHPSVGPLNRTTRSSTTVDSLLPKLVRGILRVEVAAVRPSLEGQCDSPMTLLLAAVGATVTALLELTVGPYLRIGTAEPHLVLVLGIVVTVAIGLEAGLVWAFVGGLVLDVIAQRPLGSSSFALLLCVAATAVLASLLVRIRPVVPIIATLVLSAVYSMIHFAALNALVAPIPVNDPIALILPGVVYDTILAALIGPLVISIHDRRGDVERLDW